MKFYLKEHERQLVAICDQELLGKTLKGEVEIKIGEFYQGKLVDQQQAILALKSARILNLFGKNIVSLGIKEGIIKKETVIELNGVPHAQVVKL